MNQDILNKLNSLKQVMSTVIVGQDDAIEMTLTAIIADGHILLEGVPGVAKTLMARFIAKLIDAKYGRIQFTPDLMPSDIIGTEVYDASNATFNFNPGPVFAQIILADEINRAPAKTQAALFEVMEERQITVSGKTHKMNELFTIIATQNPIEQEGTYRLPEAQLDRFLCKITMGYPSIAEEVEILRRHQSNPQYTKLSEVSPLLTPEEMLQLRAEMYNVIVDETLMQYIVNITQLTRNSPIISLPASPRAAVSMMRMAKAYALLQGRDFATPDDVRRVAVPVLSHRLQLSPDAEIEGINLSKEIERLMSTASAEIK